MSFNLILAAGLTVAALGILAALVAGVWQAGRRAARDAAELAAARDRLEMDRDADENERKVAAMTDAEVDAALRQRVRR